MTRRPVCLLLVLATAACGSTRREGPPVSDWASLFPEVVDPDRETDGPRALFKAKGTAEQLEAVERAVRVYVDEGDDAFVPVRDAIARDPVKSYWLTRHLVRFVIIAREKAANVDLAAARLDLSGEPAWARPQRHLVAMGQAAVPSIVLDLLRNRRADLVELGRELLTEIGPDALPLWRGVFGIDDPRARRACADVLAAWGGEAPAVRDLLFELTKDADFGVRAAAYRGLGKSADHVDVLIGALESDPDPFVKRKIALALGEHASRRTAAAVIDYMAAALDAGDHKGVSEADMALRRMSGRSKPASLGAWRSWLSTLVDE